MLTSGINNSLRITRHEFDYGAQKFSAFCLGLKQSFPLVMSWHPVYYQLLFKLHMSSYKTRKTFFQNKESEIGNINCMESTITKP